MGLIKNQNIHESGEVTIKPGAFKVVPDAELRDVPIDEDLESEFSDIYSDSPAEDEAKTEVTTSVTTSSRGQQILSSVSSLDDIKTEAEKIIIEAEQTAERLLAEAQRKVAAIKKQAQDEGRELGLKSARMEAGARVEEGMDVMNQAVKQRHKIIKDAEAEILRLSIKVAEQIIRSEVSLHRDVCLNIISEAIGRVSDREQLILKVNRDDVEQVKRYKDRLAALVDGVKSFSIIEDSGIDPGGCIIETNLGYVDARIATKLSVMQDALYKVAESGKK